MLRQQPSVGGGIHLPLFGNPVGFQIPQLITVCKNRKMIIFFILTSCQSQEYWLLYQSLSFEHIRSMNHNRVINVEMHSILNIYRLVSHKLELLELLELFYIYQYKEI